MPESTCSRCEGVFWPLKVVVVSRDEKVVPVVSAARGTRRTADPAASPTRVRSQNLDSTLAASTVTLVVAGPRVQPPCHLASFPLLPRCLRRSQPPRCQAVPSSIINVGCVGSPDSSNIRCASSRFPALQTPVMLGVYIFYGQMPLTPARISRRSLRATRS